MTGLILACALICLANSVHSNDKSLLIWNGGHKRITIEGCTVTPTEIENPESPAMPNSLIEFQCDADREFTFCQFRHIKPMDFDHSEEEIICNIAGGGTHSKPCQNDTRITLTSSPTSCGMRISNPVPEDTGMWTLIIGELTWPGVQTSSQDIEIYIYNQSVPVLLEWNSQVEISNNYEIWYNERLELECLAMYGRPIPEILWTINHIELPIYDDLFWIREGHGNTHDPNGYVQDWFSGLTFDLKDDFMNYLADIHGIDTSGDFTFILGCIVEQGPDGEYGSEHISTSVRVRKQNAYASGQN